jgi:stage II sporulation protein D
MRKVQLLLAVLLITVLLPLEAEAALTKGETIRVAVCKGIESVRINGAALTVVDGGGSRLETALPLTVRREKGGISVGGTTLRVLKLSSPGVIQLNGKGYRGTLEILPTEKGLLVVNEIPLEEYLVGLINCEISSQWPIEAVKAQVVVARSFALFQKSVRKKMPYHLESTVYDQVYEGCDIEDSRAARAVEETEGQVLTYNGAIIQAFFHSSCGGHTEASENVWSMRFPYLRGVECTYCMNSPTVIWEQAIPRKRLESVLRSAGYRVGGLRDVRPRSRNRSGRIGVLELVSADGTTTIPAVTFRKLVGYGIIRSTAFEVKNLDDDFVFIGLGYGHGVGLCQWGSKKRAEDGFTFTEILSYYYPGTRVVKYYSE